jgi:starch-binding outer membrane protein, SusD/RagB family
MKIIHRLLLVTVLTTGVVSSCKKNFLDEVPEAFFSTTNAFNTEADFTASMNNVYGLVRHHYYTVNDFNPFFYMYRTDAYLDLTVTSANLPGEIIPTNGIVTFAWGPHYKIIAETNTIIGRLATSSLTDVQKTSFEAKARFFRAFAYRALAYLYGGVPLVLEEIGTPKTDFTRATRKEVYTSAIKDLEFAATNLPAINTVKDGEISNLAAYHLLAEVYNADGQYQKAVDAASAVISNSNMALMTARFGSQSGVTPGDVYWDLFRPKNQNRISANNKEGIWVIQLETDVPGGGASTTGGSQGGVYALERVHAPLIRDIKINGTSVFLWPVGDYTGGRGVGFLAPSNWFSDTVWKNSNTDIRNANHNFVRDFVCNNPNTPYFGTVVSTKNPPPGSTGFYNTPLVAGKWERAFAPYQSKATSVFAHPTALYVNPSSTDPIRKYELKTGAGGTYIDQYMFRLAETYLLRAEAYLGLGNTPSAAADINVVRSRSSATPVDPGNVNIDYILDERLRELGVEEKRMLTLMRMGKWVDRTRTCNPFYGVQMQDHYNLWPIPFDEIERNRGAKLEQNPGYQ